MFLLSAVCSAQQTTGTISGRILDAAGAGIAEAAVAATHLQTGTKTQVKATPEGAYIFPALTIGDYELTVEHPGFKKTVRQGVTLHIGDHLSIEMVLEIGAVSEQVTVVAEAMQIQTESSEQSHLISGEQVRELQLNGRSFMTLIELLPGVVSDMPDRADPNTNPALYINGARSSASNFSIDGGNNSDVIVGSGSLNTFTSVETIEEVKVLTSTFSAEFGRSGVSQVNVVTRGGGRKFRGTLFEFMRNDALDAKDYFSHQVLPLKLNQFGYTIGGPVAFPGFNKKRDKTFFFFAQEFNPLTTRPAAINTQVPSAAERQGDFSGRGAGRDGVFGTGDDPVIDPETMLGLDGGVIPRQRMDPNAVKLAALWPAPNFVGPGSINYTSASPSRQRWREELVRIDHNFSQRWKIYGRYAQDTADIYNPYGGSSTTSTSTNFPGIGASNAARPGKNLVVNLTTLPSHSLLNVFTFTYAGREITQEPAVNEADRTALGIDIPEIFPENDGNVIPTINLGSGFAALNVARVWLKQLFNLELNNQLTKTMGRHVFKTGAYYSYGGNRENPTGPNTNGSFTFTTNFSRNPIANLLLGLPNTYAEAERFVVSHARFGGFEAFAQDDVRLTGRLVLNLGVRYTAYFNPYDTHNVLSNFLPSMWDPAKAPRIDPATNSGRPIAGTGDPLNGVIIAGQNSPWGKRVTNNNTDLWAPRFGFALMPFLERRIVLRGGYGIFYTRPLIGTFINNAFDNPPFSRSVTIQTPRFSDPGEGRAAAESAVNLTALGAPLDGQTIQQWNFNIQYEPMKNSVVSVAYVGTRGTHLQRPYNINNPEPGVAAARGVHVNAVRPYPGFGNITARQTTGTSIYHSLQLSFNRRMTKGLSVGGAYTYGKTIDEGSSERGGSDVPPDSRNVAAERGPANFDRTHVFTANYIYFLPSPLRGRKGLLPALVNGWQFSGITRMYSGLPFDVVMSQDVAGIGGTQNQRPNVIADTRGPRTTEQWFNRDAFARPATGTFGNMGRNSLRRPGINKWDLSLFKNFAVGEGRRLQFRAEFFNAFNHPSFDAPASSLTTTAAGVNPLANSFGVITGTRDARVLQFGMRLYF